jgi:hypothetical protein
VPFVLGAALCAGTLGMLQRRSARVAVSAG